MGCAVALLIGGVAEADGKMAWPGGKGLTRWLTQISWR